MIKIGTLHIDIKEIAAINQADSSVVFKGGGRLELLAYEIHHILQAIESSGAYEH